MSSAVTNMILRLSPERLDDDILPLVGLFATCFRLTELQASFTNSFDGLSEHEFVAAMGKVIGLGDDMNALLPEYSDEIDLSGAYYASNDITLEQKEHNKWKLRTVNVVAELCELFGQVDSCGEGTVKWEGLSNFLITMGASGGLKDTVFDDMFERRCIFGARTSEDKYIVKAVRYYPEIERVFVCVDDRVELLDLYPPHHHSNKQTEPEKLLIQSIRVQVPMKSNLKVGKGVKLKEGPRESGPKIKVKCLDCVFAESKDFIPFHGEPIRPIERATDLKPSPNRPPNSFRTLVILSSDASLTFFRFGRLNPHGEYEVAAAGRCELPLQQLRLEWCAATSSLFSCGFDGQVRVWHVQYHGIASVSLTGGASAERAKLLEGTFTLEQASSEGSSVAAGSEFVPSTHAKEFGFAGGGHTDVVGCMALCSFGTNKDTGEAEVLLLATGGLDHKIIIWDPLTLTYQYELKPRHAAGVTSLSWDGHQGLLLSASFDTTVAGFVLISNKLYPLFKLTGHSAPVVSVSCAVGTCRAVSVDSAGGVRWVDVRRECMLEANERLLCKTSTEETAGGVVAVFGCDEAAEYSANGVSLVAMGRRLQIFDSLDVQTRNPVPLCMCFGAASMTLATAHGSRVAVWDAVSGDLNRILELKDESKGDEHGDEVLSCIGLDGNDDIGDRRVVCGNMGGSVTMVDYLTGKLLAALPPHAAKVTGLVTTSSGLAVSVSEDGDLRVYDIRAAGRQTASDHELLLRVVKHCHGHGPVNCLGVSEELNVCCTGAGSALRIWDLEFLSLEAQFPTAVMPLQSPLIQELRGPTICSIAFLEPYPVVVCGDSSGYLTAFLLKDGLLKGGETGYRRLFRWRNSKGFGFVTNEYGQEMGGVELLEEDRDITALEVYFDVNGGNEIKSGVMSGSLVLYASDLNGSITAHNMSPTLASLGIKASPQSSAAHHPRRRIKRDMSDIRPSSSSRPGSPASSRQSLKDFSHISDVEIYIPPAEIEAWFGHDNTVTKLLKIERPAPLLLSCALDGSVKLWDFRVPTDQDKQADLDYEAAVAKVMIPNINIKRGGLLPPHPPPTQHTLLGVLTNGHEDRQLLLRESEMFRADEEGKEFGNEDETKDVKELRCGRAACGMPVWRYPTSNSIVTRAHMLATNTLTLGREARRRTEAIGFARAQAANYTISKSSVPLDDRLGAATSTLDPVRRQEVGRLLGQFFFGDKSWKKTKFECAKEEAERQVAHQKSTRARPKPKKRPVKDAETISKQADAFLRPRYDEATLVLIDDAKKEREQASRARLLAAVAHRPGSAVKISTKSKLQDLDPEGVEHREKKLYPTLLAEVGRKGGYRNKSRVKSPEELKLLVQPSEFLTKALSKKNKTKLSSAKLSPQPSPFKNESVSITQINEKDQGTGEIKMLPSSLWEPISLHNSVHSSNSNRSRAIDDKLLAAQQAEVHRSWTQRVASGISDGQATVVGSQISLVDGGARSIRTNQSVQTMFFGPYTRAEVLLMYQVCARAAEAGGMEDPPVKGSLLDLKLVKDEVESFALAESGDVGDYQAAVALLHRRYLGKACGELERHQVKVTADEILRAVFPLLRSYETQDAIEELSKIWNAPPVVEEVTDAELIDSMPPHMVASLKSLFALFDVRNSGVVSSLEVAQALRSSVPSGFNISVLVAAGELEHLARTIEGEEDEHDDDDDDGSDSQCFDKPKMKQKKKREPRGPIDRNITELEFILYFRELVI